MLPMMTPREVAECGIKACLDGKRVAIPGWRNRVGAVAAKMAPVQLVTRMIARFNQDK